MTIKQVYLLAIIMLVVTLITVPGHAQAYTAPDETDMNQVPTFYPCRVDLHRDPIRGDIPNANCTWTDPAKLQVWDDTAKQWGVYDNIAGFMCDNEGKCFQRGNYDMYFGNFLPKGEGRINAWFYMDTALDGRLMAYRNDQGPAAGKPRVTYEEAAMYYEDFLRAAGASDRQVTFRMNWMYTGGAEQYMADVAALAQANTTQQKPAKIGKVVEAWCNPRADDECFVNNIQIPFAELDKYLPKMDVAKVEAEGGVCEYPICYDADYKPIGVRNTMFN